MIKNSLLYAAIGAAVGLLIAHFFPLLGKSGLDKSLTDLTLKLGAEKPYVMDASIGAAVGAAIGFLTAGKK